MKEHPILFSTPMVQAILEGRKTQTRRIVKKVPVELSEDETWIEILSSKSPYGNTSDILWVRETFCEILPKSGRHYFKADIGEKANLAALETKWKPSIFMPRAACRIFLEITGITVQKLQDITEEDSKAEGVRFTDFGKNQWNQQQRGYHVFDVKTHEQCLATARTAYGNLWEKINGEESWQSNPWVWVIEFKRIQL